MPSPFGLKRGPSTYYEYPGVGHHYVWNWDGLPPGPTHAAETRGLSDYFDIKAHYHKDLGEFYPVSMTLETGRGSVLHSGPEQGKMFSMGALSNNEKTYLALAGAAAAVWWFFIRKKK